MGYFSLNPCSDIRLSFVYYHRPKKYFYDLKSMVEWVKEFDEEEVKDSRAYAQAYESFKASDLPKV